MGENLLYLKKIPVFSGLSEEELKSIEEIVVEKTFQKDSTVFMEGDPGEAIYFIKSGKIKLCKFSSDGKELILEIFGEGVVFAEVTLFHSVSYPVNAVVVEDAVLGMISNEELEKIVEKNAKMALSIIKILNKRLWSAQTKLKQLAFSDVYTRTAELLLKLARQHGKQSKKGINLSLDISRQDLANMIGTTRESVSRALSRFKKEKAIELKGKEIVILDEEIIQDWIEEA